MGYKVRPWPADLIDHKSTLIQCSKRIVGMATLSIDESKSGNPFFSNKIIPEIIRKAEFARDVSKTMIGHYKPKRGKPPKWFSVSEDVNALAMYILDDMREAQGQTRLNNYSTVQTYMRRVTLRCIKAQDLLRSVPDPDPVTQEIELDPAWDEVEI